MTGPGHYRAAETLLTDALEYDASDPAQTAAQAAMLRHAQVHATLALAAVTANASYGNMGHEAATAWKRATT